MSIKYLITGNIHLPKEGEAVPKGQAEVVTVQASGESFQESRMREIRKSGSVRGIEVSSQGSIM